VGPRYPKKLEIYVIPENPTQRNGNRVALPRNGTDRCRALDNMGMIKLIELPESGNSRYCIDIIMGSMNQSIKEKLVSTFIFYTSCGNGQLLEEAPERLIPRDPEYSEGLIRYLCSC
jgi:hypothetical protein